MPSQYGAIRSLRNGYANIILSGQSLGVLQNVLYEASGSSMWLIGTKKTPTVIIRHFANWSTRVGYAHHCLLHYAEMKLFSA